MVMTPNGFQGKHRKGVKSSPRFSSIVKAARAFPEVDRRWGAPSTTATESGSAEGSGEFDSIVAELTDRWDRGEVTRVESYLERMDSANPAEVVELIYREFCLAEERGLAPDPKDYLRRFPGREARLSRLFRLHYSVSPKRLRDWAEPDDLPEVGDQIGHFFFKRELGRGKFARVFLAEQVDLDDRLVVVKVSTRWTPEPRLLARARHSHIVEVLWHGSAENKRLQLICMPFLGGATLATLQCERRRSGERPRTGRDLLADLDRVSAPEYPKAGLARPAREIIAGLSYPAATAWVVARLAEALDHAFDQGVAHGDIKPSNILLTADGTPMLLDFNLAVGWRLPEESDLPVDRGGSTGYMAPERLRAAAEQPRQSAPSADERHRADIFALGVVLLETLTGRASDLRQSRVQAPHEIAAMIAEPGWIWDEALHWLARSSVPRGLRSILERCLATDRADRYGRASELADDLDRWRTGRPLAFAAEPPWRFRLVRWLRSQRLAVSAAVLALAVGGAAMTTLWYSFQTTLRQQAEDKLALIWDREESGVFRYHRFGHWTADDQGDPADQARHHLDRYNVLSDADWQARNDIRSLPAAERSELKLWLLEQILRYTTALGDRPGSAGDWTRAKALLDQTIAQTPASPFRTQRDRLKALLSPPTTPATVKGAEVAAARLVAPSLSDPLYWIEEYLSGVEAEPRRAREALVHYNAMLKARPHSFWGHYRAATVAYRLGDHFAAAAHLRECIAQRPKNVDLRAQLAACLFVLGQYDASLEECTKALAIDPEHAVTTRNQTYARSRLGQQDRVNSDLRRFELLTRSQSEVQMLKARLESMQVMSLGAAAAGQDRAARLLLSAEPLGLDHSILRAAQLRELGRFEDALLELDKVLAVDPEHLEARFYRAMLLRQKKRPGARKELAYLVDHPRLDELIPQYKDAISIYTLRSTDLLKRGQVAEAVEVAKAGLVQANRFSTMRGNVHYALARAYATAAKTDPSLVPRVVDELKSASSLEPSIPANQYLDDPYFIGLRDQLRLALKSDR